MERRGELATISHKFSFPPQKPQETCKTVTGNKKCVSHWSITDIRPSQAPVTLVLSISGKILQLCTKTRLLKEAIGVDLLVWIVGYKLSQIYNIP